MTEAEIPKYEKRIHEQLASIVGPEYVSNKKADLYLYSRDFITATATTRPGRCDFVVMPETVDEVQRIVRLANREKIPVIPTVSMINIGATATPLEGGIVMDLRRMNKVLEVNEDDMYVLVEGGITWADLKGYLEKNHPDFRIGLTLSPPATGVVPSCLEYGMFDTSFLFGTGAEHINGLEVVLPTGELIRTGPSMISPDWVSRGPVPDLTGLFIGWEGTTGIVTKASIKIWPKLPKTDVAVISMDWDQGIEIAKRLARAHLGIYSHQLANHPFIIAMFGCFTNPEEFVPYEPEKNGLHDCYNLLSIGAYTEKEMEAKVEAVEAIAKEGGGEVRVVEDLMVDFNVRTGIPCLAHPHQCWGVWYTYKGGGHEWCGTLGSVRKTLEFYYKGREIAWKKYHKHSFYAHRFLFGGHIHMLRHLLACNKNDPEDTKKLLMLNKELTELALELGLIRYKPPYWAKAMESEKAHPGSVELIRKVKKLLDPNRIMNPGHEW